MVTRRVRGLGMVNVIKEIKYMVMPEDYFL